MNCALQEQRTGVNTRGTETGAPHNHKRKLLLVVMEEIEPLNTEFLIHSM
jgi:hypothetical protein